MGRWGSGDAAAEAESYLASPTVSQGTGKHPSFCELLFSSLHVAEKRILTFRRLQAFIFFLR